jgi:hypothetical protein
MFYCKGPFESRAKVRKRINHSVAIFITVYEHYYGQNLQHATIIATKQMNCTAKKWAFYKWGCFTQHIAWLSPESND